MDAPNGPHQTWPHKLGFPDGVKSLAEYRDYLSQLENLGDAVFRGEHEYYDTYVLPKCFRNGKKWRPLSNNTNLSSIEYWQIRLCQVIRLWNVFRFGLNGSQWVGMAQHYNRKTRLVDVTFNSEFALFFACWNMGERTPSSKDGWVYIFPKDTFRPMSMPRDEVGKRDIEQGISSDFRDLFDGSSASQTYEGVAHLYTPEADRLFNRRMTAQAGGFLWWQPPDDNRPHVIIPVKIHHAAKQPILKELDAIKISIVGLFPDRFGRKQLQRAKANEA
jgi:hypothetical protein